MNRFTAQGIVDDFYDGKRIMCITHPSNTREWFHGIEECLDGDVKIIRTNGRQEIHDTLSDAVRHATSSGGRILFRTTPAASRGHQLDTIILDRHYSELFDVTEPRWADLCVAAAEVVRL